MAEDTTFAQRTAHGLNERPLRAGDDCPDARCSMTVHVLRHDRDPQLDAPRHPDAPEREVVCPHHGVVQER